jgi:hypothetical protein
MPRINNEPTEFGGVTSSFRVQSVAESIGYYTRCLGFNVDWESAQGNLGAWIWVAVTAADPLLEEFRLEGEGAPSAHKL